MSDEQQQGAQDEAAVREEDLELQAEAADAVRGGSCSDGQHLPGGVIVTH